MTITEKILQTEYSEEFDTLRKDRLLLHQIKVDYNPSFDNIRKNMMTMSYYKYGPLIENYKNEKCLDAIGNLIMCIGKYLDTGNTEYIADIANYAMIEYMYPQCPKKHSILLESEEFKTPLVTLSHLIAQVKKYLSSGDDKCLADIANFAMIEYTAPQHPKAFYKATDNPQCRIIGFGVNEVKHLSSYNHFL